jgi:hypothetical protein
MKKGCTGFMNRKNNRVKKKKTTRFSTYWMEMHFFHSVVGFNPFLCFSKVSSLPPCVVVAVLNTDRTRDFTPTSSAARRDGSIQPGDTPKGGE